MRVVRSPDRVNPYIATTDVMISVVLVFVLMMVTLVLVDTAKKAAVASANATTGLRALHELRAEALAQAVAGMPEEHRPVLKPTANDPEGTQRWHFSGARLFQPGTTVLTAEGRETIQAFGHVLYEASTWRRIRVEGHSRRTSEGEEDDWEGSALRAAAVVRELIGGAMLKPWWLAVAGRGGQAPLDPALNQPELDERVEIVVEYCMGDRCSRGEVDEETGL